MATPTLTTHTIDGVLGPIAIDVRAGGRNAARPAVVLLHGYKGFKDWGMFPPFADRLAKAGVSVIAANVSGCGVDASGTLTHPERFAANTFSIELEDARRVLDAAATGTLGVVAPSSIGVVGHSRGGGIAVLLAGGDSRVRALVTWASISTVERWSPIDTKAWRANGRLEQRNTRTGDVLWLDVAVLDDIEANHTGSLDIGAAAARLTIPWLLIQGTADPAVTMDEANALHAAQPAAETLYIAGAGHTFGAVHPWAGTTPALDQVMEATIRWFGRHLA